MSYDPEVAGLPKWVWDLLIGIDRYEDEHPLLYEMGDYEDGKPTYKRYPCARGKKVYDVVPDDVWTAAQAIREYAWATEDAKGSPDATP